ncbi:MAG: hypothetical protein QNJ05_08155 [Woeseiaceae bacterium]|nr:hypothetical protein [Woeseiaceae bacterium]
MKIAGFVLALFASMSVAVAQQAGGPADLDAEQLAEMERRAQFEAGFKAIVDDINRGSFASFNAAINRQDMLERIFGLRLIDQRVKQSFSEDFESSLPNMIERMFIVAKDHEAKAHLLGFDSRGFLGRATVRYDLPDFQYTYHEYDLRMTEAGKIYIADWTDFLRGEGFSDSIGETLIAAAPSKQAVRKLIDLPRVSDSQVFQVTELLKAVRDRKVDRFVEIWGNLGDDLKAQRITVLSHVHLMKDTRNRRKLRTALIEMAKFFPKEPAYSLMLLDYYFPSRRYQEAFDALKRLESRLGVEDSAMQARLSAASLVLRNTDDAAAYAARAVEMEPGLELGWWSLARASAVNSDFDTAVRALTELEDQFGYDLGPEALGKDPLFAQVVRSAAYEEWSASRQ